MATMIKVPPFPESVTEGTVVRWHKRPGEAVARDETVVDIETDKVMFEVPAPADGVLQEILAGEGETVRAGQDLGVLTAGDDVAQPAVRATASPPAGEPHVAGEVRSADEGAAGLESPPMSAPISPSARRLIAEHGLEPGQIRGSGKGGCILKEDVLRHLEVQAEGPAGAQSEARAAAPRETADRTAVAAPTFTPASTQVSAQASTPVSERETMPAASEGLSERGERRVPMTRLRARIAERLVQAQHSAAILTTFNEVNMAPVMTLRQRYRQAFEETHGVRLGFMSFFVKASVEALRRFPVVNAYVDGEDIVYHDYYDIGVAIGAPRGLVVPILRDADRLSMAEIERQIDDFARRAQDGKLTLEELSGGTFTITNGGVFGSLLSTPILNPPQSAILGMHKIQQRPVVEDGEVVVRPMMYLALSYDHRLIDGREAVQFLVTIKDMLEDPARMFIGI